MTLLPHINYGLYAGCGACAELYPVFFVMRDDKAWVINCDKFILEEHKKSFTALSAP